MPSLKTARRVSDAKTNNARTIGRIHKENSDFVMEYTWDTDVQSKTCYIYDYYHDDFYIDEFGNKTSLKDGMSYENTNKTKIDAKFIVKSHQSMDKDQVEYYLQFKPSQKTRFSEDDELYYFETDYRQRYHNGDFIGLYVDVPDDSGRYHKWLICRGEYSNQFPKYLILPCDYELMWIETDGQYRYKRRMWAVLRLQNSYTIGTYVDRYMTHLDNQNKIWLPLNSITEKIWYTDDDSNNMRVIVSALTEHPTVWKITKCETVSPIGLQKLTLYTNFFNEHTDYVNIKTGEMYADYYSSEIDPIDPNDNSSAVPLVAAEITSSTSMVKIGGTYKSLVLNLLDNSNNDITDKYLNATFTWTCNINDEDWTDKVIWHNGTLFNQKKIKLANDYSLIGQVLAIKCVIAYDDEIIESNLLQLEIVG